MSPQSMRQVDTDDDPLVALHRVGMYVMPQVLKRCAHANACGDWFGQHIPLCTEYLMALGCSPCCRGASQARCFRLVGKKTP